MEIVLYSKLLFLFQLIVVAWTCTFPTELQGDWQSSILGLLNFNTTSFNGITVSNFGRLPFTCSQKNGSLYMVESSQFNFASVNFKAYICFDIRKEDNFKFIYYRATEKDPSTNNERVYITAASETVTMDKVCTEKEPYSPGSYSILLKTDYIDMSTITCPNAILGLFNVQYTNQAGTAECPGGAYLDVCSNKTQLSFNFTSCGANTNLPDSLDCIYKSDNNNVTYISVYSRGSGIFQCLGVSRDNTTLFLSQHNNDCSPNQTGSAVAAGGYLMNLTLPSNTTGHCEDTDEATTVVPTDTGNTYMTSLSTVPQGGRDNYNHASALKTNSIMFILSSLTAAIYLNSFLAE